MLAFQLITSIAVTLSLALAATAAPTENEGHLRDRNQGMRGCIGAAISCQYKTGRCAQICGENTISSICYCPDGTAANPYTGAACINIFTAMGRHKC